MHPPSFFGGILFVAVGLFLFLWPRRFWSITEGWKYDNVRDVQLSDVYLFWMKLNGGAVLLVGLLFLLQAAGLIRGV